MTHKMVARDQPWAWPSCLARSAAARSAGLAEVSAGCCQRVGGAVPFLRRQEEARAWQLRLQ